MLHITKNPLVLVPLVLSPMQRHTICEMQASVARRRRNIFQPDIVHATLQGWVGP